jgi:glycosyl-4,4'-diaponeurosporenoate acyltransferase
VTGDWPLALLDALVWGLLSVAAGYWGYRRSPARLARDGPLTRLRAFERDGRWYERWLRIRSWKDRVPEAGGAFAGGLSKRHLPGRDPALLERFVAETRRAEGVHAALLVAAPLFLLWNPLWLGLVMVAYGVVANLPCLLIQRYNRARLLRLLARPRRGPGPATG